MIGVRVPWLAVSVTPAPDDPERLEAIAHCGRCGAASAPMPIDSPVVVAPEIEHRAGCPVPVALERARLARTN